VNHRPEGGYPHARGYELVSLGRFEGEVVAREITIHLGTDLEILVNPGASATFATGIEYS